MHRTALRRGDLELLFWTALRFFVRQFPWEIVPVPWEQQAVAIAAIVELRQEADIPHADQVAAQQQLEVIDLTQSDDEGAGSDAESCSSAISL